jgi:hypothetical protein
VTTARAETAFVKKSAFAMIVLLHKVDASRETAIYTPRQRTEQRRNQNYVKAK